MTKQYNGRDAVSVRDLTFSYDGQRDVLKGISFDIPKGSYTAVIGHNGSGKSTLAKLLIGLLPAASGSISILGTELTEDSVYDIRTSTESCFRIRTISSSAALWRMTLPSVWKTAAFPRNRCRN